MYIIDNQVCIQSLNAIWSDKTRALTRDWECEKKKKNRNLRVGRSLILWLAPVDPNQVIQFIHHCPYMYDH